jgi:hypothetical protein
LIRELVINRFNAKGIRITSATAIGNHVQGNRIDTDAANSAPSRSPSIHSRYAWFTWHKDK